MLNSSVPAFLRIWHPWRAIFRKEGGKLLKKKLKAEKEEETSLTISRKHLEILNLNESPLTHFITILCSYLKLWSACGRSLLKNQWREERTKGGLDIFDLFIYLSFQLMGLEVYKLNMESLFKLWEYLLHVVSADVRGYFYPSPDLWTNCLNR